MQGPADIGIVIKLRLANRRPHARTRGEVRDHVEFFSMKNPVYRSAIAQVHTMNHDIARHGLDIRVLDLRVVKLVEIVEDRDGVTGREQLLDKVGADEPRTARNQNSHRASVKMKLTASKGRTWLGWTIMFAGLFLLALCSSLFWRLWPELHRPTRVGPAFQIVPALFLASLPTAARFDFPIGSENGALAYNAQPFTQNRHLGDDLNGIGGENSDLGDPIYAVADGRVLFAEEGGPGW